MESSNINPPAACPALLAPGAAATWNDWLARLPKVELHVHVVGALRATTLADLAREAGLALPRPAETLYQYAGFYDFIEVFRLAAQALRTAAHFERAVHEYVEDAVAAGSLAHVEFFFNPSYGQAVGVGYRAQLEGLRAGVRAAQRDFGVTALLIPSLDREFGPGVASQVLDEVLAHRCEEVAGIGLDGPEDRGPPLAFAEVFRRAGAAGLRRTAHVCEDYAPTPAANYLACREVLGCDRLDHGYRVLSDPAMVARARDDGLVFTVCPKPSTRERDALRRGAIDGMWQAGLRLSPATDDPAMFRTDLAEAYGRLFPAPDLPRLRQMSLAGVDACWLDEGRQAALRQQIEGFLASGEFPVA